jgi:hypothetical protein
MGQTGHRPFEELALSSDLDYFGFADLSKTLPAARRGLAGANETREPIETSSGCDKTDNRYCEADDDAS